MREAEEHYKCIDENKTNADGTQNVQEDGASNENGEEEKKEQVNGATPEDQPTQFAKRLSL